MFHYYASRKHQETGVFLMILGSIEAEHCLAMGKCRIFRVNYANKLRKIFRLKILKIEGINSYYPGSFGQMTAKSIFY